MEETLIILGTGNATVTKCYNTCFAIKNGSEYFLIDTGGGNGIMTQLEKAEIPMEQIHEIFISHEHTDHLLGLIWLIRMIATKMKKGKYEGNLNIYCHAQLKETILTIVKLTVQDKFVKMIGERIFLHEVEDGEIKDILGYKIIFFDILSKKAKQYGFTMQLKSGKKFTFWEMSHTENMNINMHLSQIGYYMKRFAFMRKETYLLLMKEIILL